MSRTRQDPIVRMAHVVGDFSNPFYAEERQRDVWNEASAFGLQLLLWTSLLAATGTVWVVGAPAVPYACGALVLVGVVSGLTVAYAWRLGVEVTGWHSVLRWRLLPFVALFAGLLAGVLRAQAGDLATSLATGMLTGALLGLLAIVALSRRAR